METVRERFLTASLACEAMASIPKALAALAAANKPSKFLCVLDSVRDHTAAWNAVKDSVATELTALSTPVDDFEGGGVSAHHTAAAFARRAYFRAAAACDNWAGESNVGSYTNGVLLEGKRFDTSLVIPFWDDVRRTFDGWPTFDTDRLGMLVRRERVIVSALLRDGIEATHVVDLASKGVAPRNELFKTWYEDEASDTHHSPTTIKIRWNAMSLDARKQVCPANHGKVTLGTVKGVVCRRNPVRKG